MLCASRQDCVPSRRVRRSPPLLWTREEPCTRHSRQSHAHASIRELPLLSPTWKKGTHTHNESDAAVESHYRRRQISTTPPTVFDSAAKRSRFHRRPFSIPPPTVPEFTAERSRLHRRRAFSTPPPHGLNSTADRSRLHRRPGVSPPCDRTGTWHLRARARSRSSRSRRTGACATAACAAAASCRAGRRASSPRLVGK